MADCQVLPTDTGRHIVRYGVAFRSWEMSACRSALLLFRQTSRESCQRDLGQICGLLATRHGCHEVRHPGGIPAPVDAAEVEGGHQSAGARHHPGKQASRMEWLEELADHEGRRNVTQRHTTGPSFHDHPRASRPRGHEENNGIECRRSPPAETSDLVTSRFSMAPRYSPDGRPGQPGRRGPTRRTGAVRGSLAPTRRPGQGLKG